jgi:hypothetical protein
MYARRFRRRSFSRRQQFGLSRFVTDTIAFSPKFTSSDQADTNAFAVVPGIAMAGVRISFRFELSLPNPLAFALIYFPEGINPETTSLTESKPETPSRLYTPEQHIMTSGLVPDNVLTIAASFRTRSLAHNDTMHLLARPFDAPVSKPS